MSRRQNKLQEDTVVADKIGILERYDKTIAYANAVILLFLSAQYLYYWINPTIENLELIRNLFWLFLFEVLAVHSTPFMSLFPRFMLFVVIPFYGLFVYALSVSMGSDYIMITYFILIFSRLRYVFFNVDASVKWRSSIQAFIMTFGYVILFAMVGCSSDIVPKLGFTDEFMNMRYLGDKLDVAETVSEQCFAPNIVSPHILFMVATLYYLLSAFLEYHICRGRSQFAKWVSSQG